MGVGLIFSKRRRVSDVAFREKTEKFTPSGAMVAPRGRGLPGFKSKAVKFLQGSLSYRLKAFFVAAKASGTRLNRAGTRKRVKTVEPRESVSYCMFGPFILSSVHDRFAKSRQPGFHRSDDFLRFHHH
jgi:hypothetical protein